MHDSVDTTTRYVCPACGMILESDYGTMTSEILRHNRVCKRSSCQNCFFYLEHTCNGCPEKVCKSWKGNK